MSKAGYPYDNAPMVRYFNTLKNECINLYGFRTEEQMHQTVFCWLDILLFGISIWVVDSN